MRLIQALLLRHGVPAERVLGGPPKILCTLQEKAGAGLPHHPGPVVMERRATVKRKPAPQQIELPYEGEES